MLPSREWRVAAQRATPRQQRAAQKQHSQGHARGHDGRGPALPGACILGYLGMRDRGLDSRPPQDGAPPPPPRPTPPLCRQHVVPGSPSQPVLPSKPPLPLWRHGRILDQKKGVLASGAGGLCGTRDEYHIFCTFNLASEWYGI